MNKSVIFPILVGVVALASFLAVNANLGTLKKNLEIERYNKLDAESKLEVTMRNSRRVQEELSDAKRKLEGIQGIVSEGQSTTTQLKTQIDMTVRENENLKQTVRKLQDELAASQQQIAAAQQAAAASSANPPTGTNN